MTSADELTSLSALAAGRLLAAGHVSSVELTEAYLERIRRQDPLVRAYLAVTADVARRQAAEADVRLAKGDSGALLGVPYALKDIFLTQGITTTAGSRMLATYVPPDSATVYERLRGAGAVLLGKLNLDEFAMGSSTENSAFFPTRNPWDLERVPGGSSGGSAAAVAANLCAFSLGTDTGGSIRQPAALCGIVGIKPTYGRVSRYGLVAFASSLDQAGPLTKTVADAAAVLSTIAGHDPADATSLESPVPDYSAAIGGPLAGVRVGVPAEYFGPGLHDGVRTAVRGALSVLADLGATCLDVALPHTRYAVATYYLVAPAEASANLARYDGLRYGFTRDGADLWNRLQATRAEGFGPEVKRRIMLGTYALCSGYYDRYYREATRVRSRIGGDFAAAFEECDVIVGPTAPEPAFRLGERSGDPLAMYLSDIYTIGPSLAGCPSLSQPCGLADGLPVGLQVIGPPNGEEMVLRVAAAVEAATDWSLLRPTLRGPDA